MKQFLVLILALLVWSGHGLYAEDFAAPAGSTVAVNTVAVELEPFQWPVAAIVAGRHVKIVSKFGQRQVPKAVSGSTGTVAAAGTELHEGIDFGVPAGTSIRVARSGKVLFAGFSTAYVTRKDKREKNHLVIVRHSDGMSTRYVHLDRLIVRPGVDIKAGDVIGTSSASDELTESVVHFEIRDASGKALDPMILLNDTTKAP